MPSLLKGAGFKKRNGFGASVSDIVFMLLSSCFYRSNKSIYGNFGHSDRVPVCTSKSSIYRFLSNERNNWRLLNLKLAKEVIDSFTKLSDADRRYCLILDDSMLESRKGKEVELLSRHPFCFQMFGIIVLKALNTAPRLASSATMSITVSSPAMVPIISGNS